MALRLERRLAATAVAAVVAAVGAGAAAACDHDGQSGVMAARFAMVSHHHGWRHHHGGLLSIPAAYLGVTTDQLKAQLRSGQTLAQIANATPGKSAQGLVDYVVAQAKARLDAKVAAGRLTQEQENGWLARLTDVVTAVVNGTWHR